MERVEQGSTPIISNGDDTMVPSQFEGYENPGWLSKEPPTGIVVPRNLRRIADDPNEMSTDRYLLNLGPQHPSTHGVLRVVAELDGESVMSTEAHIGQLHRGIEKLAEHHRYYQIGSLMDRGDYAAGIHGELAVALSTEKLAEIEVPRRAQWIRILVGEINRITSHLLWFGPLSLDAGAMAPFLYVMRDREELLEILEEVSGARLMFNYIRPGGVTGDWTVRADQKLRQFLATIDGYMQEHYDIIMESELFQQRTKGIGIITKADALSFGASGFVLRASGVDFDVRRDRPYSCYDEMEFDVPVSDGCDVWARAVVRFEEMRQSIRMMRQVVDGLPEGSIMAEMPRVLRVPAGEAYVPIEAPRGEMGVHLYSDGTDKPTRVRYRPPTLYHLQIADTIAPGNMLADAIVTLGSVDLVLGEVDR